MTRDLFSKLVAAGLSAGVFLLWWPEHHATSGLTSLIVRGALWTLCFELLVVAFAPLERRMTAALRRSRRGRLEHRLAAVPPRARLGGACVLACAGAALPMSLLAGVHAPRPHRPVAKRVIVVKRRVVKRVVVREARPAPAAAAPPSPPVTASAAVAPPKQKPAPRRTPDKPAATPAPKRTNT